MALQNPFNRPLATEAEAEAGLTDLKAMSPLKTAAAIAGLTGDDSAAAVAVLLGNHEAATGTAVHGLGTMATEAATDFLAVTGDAMTGKLAIAVPTATANALVLQTTDDSSVKSLLEARTAAGAATMWVSEDGQINTKPPTTSTIGLRVERADSSSTVFSVDGEGKSFQNILGVGVNPSSTYQARIVTAIGSRTALLVNANPSQSVPTVIIKNGASQTGNSFEVQASGGGVSFSIGESGNIADVTMKSGATQAAAGAATGELWKTSGHATLPDNVVLHGV